MSLPSPAGDAAFHLSQDALEAALAALPPPPREAGRVELIVVRHPNGLRLTPATLRFTPAGGADGDAWSRGRRRPDTQVSVMRTDVGRVIANGQALSLFGDNLLVDLDLDAEALPPGTHLRIGTATFAVTPEPHTGCNQYRQRFGAAALRLVNSPERRGQHLRGVYFRVIEAGLVSVGDAITRTASAG